MYESCTHLAAEHNSTFFPVAISNENKQAHSSRFLISATYTFSDEFVPTRNAVARFGDVELSLFASAAKSYFFKLFISDMHVHVQQHLVMRLAAHNHYHTINTYSAKYFMMQCQAMIPQVRLLIF